MKEEEDSTTAENTIVVIVYLLERCHSLEVADTSSSGYFVPPTLNVSSSSVSSTLSHKRRDIRKKVTEHKTCVLIFSTTFVQSVSYSKKN
jgi:hypothetical protein